MTSFITTMPVLADGSERQERTRRDHTWRRPAAALSRWLRAMHTDPRTRYLSAAADLPDIERRMQQWDEYEAGRLRRLLLTL